jgi:hypothetical protein
MQRLIIAMQTSFFQCLLLTLLCAPCFSIAQPPTTHLDLNAFTPSTTPTLLPAPDTQTSDSIDHIKPPDTASGSPCVITGFGCNGTLCRNHGGHCLPNFWAGKCEQKVLYDYGPSMGTLQTSYWVFNPQTREACEHCLCRKAQNKNYYASTKAEDAKHINQASRSKESCNMIGTKRGHCDRAQCKEDGGACTLDSLKKCTFSHLGAQRTNQASCINCACRKAPRTKPLRGGFKRMSYGPSTRVSGDVSQGQEPLKLPEPSGQESGHMFQAQELLRPPDMNLDPLGSSKRRKSNTPSRASMGE